jgi:hypothetical protein
MTKKTIQNLFQIKGNDKATLIVHALDAISANPSMISILCDHGSSTHAFPEHIKDFASELEWAGSKL